MQTQLRKGVLDMCVLGLLARGDSYTYELVKQLESYMEISEGTIYPLMRRLQKEGWVESYLQASTSGPARKYYRLTDSGRASLALMREQWRVFCGEIDAILNH